MHDPIKIAELAKKLCSEYLTLIPKTGSFEPITYSKLTDFITEILLISPDLYDIIQEIPIVKFIEKHTGKESYFYYKIIIFIMLFTLFINKYYLKLDYIKSEEAKSEITLLLKPILNKLYNRDGLATVVYNMCFF